MNKMLKIYSVMLPIIGFSSAAMAVTYSEVVNSTPVQAGHTADVVATCPVGTSLTGGGFEIDPNRAYSSVVVAGFGGGAVSIPFSAILVTVNVPSASGTGWEVNGVALRDTTLIAVARCATP